MDSKDNDCFYRLTSRMFENQLTDSEFKNKEKEALNELAKYEFLYLKKDGFNNEQIFLYTSESKFNEAWGLMAPMIKASQFKSGNEYSVYEYLLTFRNKTIESDFITIDATGDGNLGFTIRLQDYLFKNLENYKKQVNLKL